VKVPAELIRLENANMSKNANVSFDRRKSSICLICECGSQINLLYDAKKMGKAIALHAKEHAKEKIAGASSNAEAIRIEDFLTEQVFTIIKSLKQP
jgi:hypothetical protein